MITLDSESGAAARHHLSACPSSLSCPASPSCPSSVSCPSSPSQVHATVLRRPVLPRVAPFSRSLAHTRPLSFFYPRAVSADTGGGPAELASTARGVRAAMPASPDALKSAQPAPSPSLITAAAKQPTKPSHTLPQSMLFISTLDVLSPTPERLSCKSLLHVSRMSPTCLLNVSPECVSHLNLFHTRTCPLLRDKTPRAASGALLH